MADSSSNVPVVIQAKKALNQFKQEIANELGLQSWQQATPTGYYGFVSSRDNGAVGGHMVRRMIEAAEKSLMEQTMVDVKSGFAQGYNQAAGPSAASFSNQTASTSTGMSK